MISVVVPTYKEAANIPVLARKIDEAMKASKNHYEIVIVDDNSRDGIVEAVDALNKKKYPVRIEVRTNERGLSSAVIRGITISRGDVVVVMDADLSHPPEKIPDLVREITENGAEFVIGSRFVKGGSAEHFNWFRRLNAWISKTLARPFTRVSDPMAGFFAFPRGILRDTSILNPIGFKIGLEIIVKASPSKTAEIPIAFRERLHGESKLSIREQIFYLVHIGRLFEYKHPTLTQFLIFSIIGGTGMIIDLASVFVTYGLLAIPYRAARVVGFVFALTSNFCLNRKFTFKKSGGGPVRQYVTFFAVCLTGFGVNWLISVYLFEHFDFFHQLYLFAAFIGILGGLVINFTGSKFIAFR